MGKRVEEIGSGFERKGSGSMGVMSGDLLDWTGMWMWGFGMSSRDLGLGLGYVDLICDMSRWRRWWDRSNQSQW